MNRFRATTPIRALLLSVLACVAAAARSGSRVRVVAAAGDRLWLECRAPAPQIGAVDIRGSTCSIVYAPGAGRVRRRGYPDLPFYMVRIPAPDAGTMRLRVVDVDDRLIDCAPPAPSRGFFSRSGRPPPREFGPFYRSRDVFPKSAAKLASVWRIQSRRGAAIAFYPYRYDAAACALRVARRILVEVRVTARPGPAVRRRRRTSRLFQAMLRRSFLRGVPDSFLRGSPSLTVTGDDSAITRDVAGNVPGEEGALLVIAPDGWLDELDDFVRWKRQRGLRVLTASYPHDTGSGTDALQAYIADEYANDAVDFVILVGDAEDIPVQTRLDVDSSGIPSDTVLTLTDGDDFYHDLFISRISASSAQAAAYQAWKFVDYEKAPGALRGGDWLARAVCIASDQGGTTSTFGKDDWEVLDAERDRLLAGGYQVVDQLYDPGVTAQQIADALNAGRGLVYYLGHGSSTDWHTGDFYTTDAYALSNGEKFPFVVSGACHIGKFNLTGEDVLAEAFMRVGSKSTPAGAVGVVASTTAMDWDPPIVMIQAFTAYLLDESPFEAGGMTFDEDAGVFTAGAVSFFSVQRAMDWCYGTPEEGAEAAERIMEQTHLFGDCTLGLRVGPPGALLVEHPDIIAPGETVEVSVRDADRRAPVAGAVVCFYRDDGLQTVGKTGADGTASVTVDAGDSGDPVTLTVYHSDYIPYQARIETGGGPLRIYSTDVLPTAFVGEAYTFDFKAAGGTPPYTWAISTPGTAPSWTVLDPASGRLTGVPDSSGTWQFTVSVTDSAARAEVRQTVTLTAGAAVTLTGGTLPAGMVGVKYSGAIQASGDFPPFTYSPASGTMPPGLDLLANGSVQGIPAESGEWTFSVNVVDAQGRTATASWTVTVAANPEVWIYPAALPVADRGTPYDVSLTAVGGTGRKFSWTLADGSLPPGLTFGSDGTLTGVPEQGGVWQFTVHVEDDDTPPHGADKTYTLTVQVPVHFLDVALPAAAPQVFYETRLPYEGTYTPITIKAADELGLERSDAPSSFAQAADAGEKQPWNSGDNPQDWDERQWPLDLGFLFPFYGVEYTSVRVGDNGYLILGDAPSPDPLWDASEANLRSTAMIAPFWNDLILGPLPTGEPDTGIFVERGVNRETAWITIRWCGREYDHQNDPDWTLNFAVTLVSDGTIRFRYGHIQTTNRVAVGVSDGQGHADVVWTQPKYFPADPPEGPDFWSDHDDVLFLPVLPLPDWLTLDSDGDLSGTPPTAGVYRFRATARDAAGYSDSKLFELTVTDSGGFALSFEQGWNCVSLPVTPADPSPETVFSGADAVWAWDPAGGTYVQPQFVEAGVGYWVHSSLVRSTVWIRGETPATTTRDVPAGWTLLGPFADRPLPELPDLIPPVWTWRDGRYVVADVLQRGAGYWFYFVAPTTLDLGPR